MPHSKAKIPLLPRCQPNDLGRSCYYRVLTLPQKAFYFKLNYWAFMGAPSDRIEFTLAPELSAQDLFAAYTALSLDHPEYFFLTNSLKSVRINRSKGTALMKICLLYTQSQIREIQQTLAETLTRLTRDIAPHSNDFEREKAVYTWMASICAYHNTKSHDEHNIVAPLLRHEGVCEGIAKLLTLGLRAVGLPAVCVEGDAAGTPHVWNMVWLDGIPYHLDVTWDLRQHENSSYPFCSFHYLNLNDAEITRAFHTRFQHPALPACLSTLHNFYRMNKTSFESPVQLKEYMAAHKTEFFQGDPFYLQLLFAENKAAAAEALADALPPAEKSEYSYMYRYSKNDHGLIFYKI